MTGFRGLSCFYHETWRGILQKYLKIIGQHSQGAVISLLSVQREWNHFKFHHNVKSHVRTLELTGAVSMKTCENWHVFLYMLEWWCCNVSWWLEPQAPAQLSNPATAPVSLSLMPLCLFNAPSSWHHLSSGDGAKFITIWLFSAFLYPGSWRRLWFCVHSFSHLVPSCAVKAWLPRCHAWIHLLGLAATVQGLSLLDLP